ncbi:MAG: deoxyribose-phosphate aldolase, partial [Chloroflexi bacterium]|nr:deoxyribose-phosphate aldolase [Chloroflexota bacterium]
MDLALSPSAIAAIRERVLDALHGFEGFPPREVPEPPPVTLETLPRYLDHTLLKPEATPAQIQALVEAARRWRFAAACVNPRFVPLVVEGLRDSPVVACTVVGFPLGATTTSAKVHEASEALAAGAREIDMVLPIGLLKARAYREVAEDIAAVVGVARAHAARVKVILETALLSDEEKVAAAVIAQRAGADFVKTSTGFGPGGATVEDVALLRAVVGPRMGVKASGGIRTCAQALAM